MHHWRNKVQPLQEDASDGDVGTVLQDHCASSQKQLLKSCDQPGLRGDTLSCLHMFHIGYLAEDIEKKQGEQLRKKRKEVLQQDAHVRRQSEGQVVFSAVQALQNENVELRAELKILRAQFEKVEKERKKAEWWMRQRKEYKEKYERVFRESKQRYLDGYIALQELQHENAKIMDELKTLRARLQKWESFVSSFPSITPSSSARRSPLDSRECPTDGTMTKPSTCISHSSHRLPPLTSPPPLPPLSPSATLSASSTRSSTCPLSSAVLPGTGLSRRAQTYVVTTEDTTAAQTLKEERDVAASHTDLEDSEEDLKMVSLEWKEESIPRQRCSGENERKKLTSNTQRGWISRFKMGVKELQDVLQKEEEHDEAQQSSERSLKKKLEKKLLNILQTTEKAEKKAREKERREQQRKMKNVAGATGQGVKEEVQPERVKMGTLQKGKRFLKQLWFTVKRR